jgi:hypothetical protein
MIWEIMAGIQARLDTIAGLRTDAITPESTNTPFAFVGVPHRIDYHATQGVPRGKVALFFTVTVGVSSVVDRVGQSQLAGYADPTGTPSIKAAIEADRTLGGVVDDCIVVSFERNDSVGVTGDPEAKFYGGEFVLQVVATPT